ncbi:hypothetical protein GCM10027575_12620 [Phytohabitans suffuscus]
MTPDGVVLPATLGLAKGELMEDYLRQFGLGPRTQERVWLDCGSGGDGLEREWDRDGPRRRSIHRSRGATCSARRSARRCPAPGRATTTRTTDRSRRSTSLPGAITRAVGGRRDLVSVLPCDAAAGRAPALPHRRDPAGGRRHGPAIGSR